MTGYQLEIADAAEMQPLRAMQANELRGPAQDGTEEGILTYRADFVKIECREAAGYACIGTYERYQGVILEYFLLHQYRVDAVSIIKEIIRQFHCTQWLVNTQDFFAFPVMLDARLEYEIDAYLFAIDDSIDVPSERPPDIWVDITTLGELAEVYPLLMQDGFYTGGDMNSLLPFIAQNEMYTMRKGGALIGAGFAGVCKRTPQYADIAMIIDRGHRRSGYGALLVKTLIERCRSRELIPTAVCDVKNFASRSALQRAGFSLSGCLLAARVDGILL